ncbi:MAG: extracellular solute-binding protein [Acidimicrobiales bacterium]|nr:extracellular solute-binding protein [Acidimicrobiales bacterium]
MSRRFLVVPSLVLVFSLFAVSCSESSDPESLSGVAAQIYAGECAEQSGNEVVIYSGRTENLIEPVLDAFACETGVPVAVRWGASTDLALLVEADGDRTEADVFLSRSPGPVGFLESRDLLGEIDSDVLDLVSPENRSGSNTWVGFSGRKRVLVYNVDQLETGELPASVFELTDEKWRGKVGIPATNGSFVDWFTVFRDVHGDDVATEWLDDMVANDADLYSNNRSIVEAAGRGEIDVGLVNHYYNYQEVAAAGETHRALNHDFADDDIGSLLIITAATVLKSTDAPDEAAQLLRYLLSAPVQQYFTDETFEYPLAAGVEANSTLPPLTALEIGSVDFDALGGGFATTNDIIEASGILDS